MGQPWFHVKESYAETCDQVDVLMLLQQFGCKRLSMGCHIISQLSACKNKHISVTISALSS